MPILYYRGGPSSRHIHTQCLTAPFINDVADTNGRRYLQEIWGDASVQAHRAISLKDVSYNSYHTTHFLGPSNICDYCKTQVVMAIMNCVHQPVWTWTLRMWHLRFWSSECLLGCDTVYFGKQVPAFLRDKLLHFLPASLLLPPCNAGTHYQSTKSHIPQDFMQLNTLMPYYPSTWNCEYVNNAYSCQYIYYHKYQ